MKQYILSLIDKDLQRLRDSLPYYDLVANTTEEKEYVMKRKDEINTRIEVIEAYKVGVYLSNLATT